MPSAPITRPVPGQSGRSAVSVVLLVIVAPQRTAGAPAAAVPAPTRQPPATSTSTCARPILIIAPPVVLYGCDKRLRGRYRPATRRLRPARRGTVVRLELDFRILGPLEVLAPSGAIRLGGPRQRSVLAILL